MTVREVAQVLRCSPATVRRRVREGELEAIRAGAGPRTPFRVDRGQLHAYIYGEEGADRAESNG